MFFKEEDGIRCYKVTGVRKCALPISQPRPQPAPAEPRVDQSTAQMAPAGQRGEVQSGARLPMPPRPSPSPKIGRASRRERVKMAVAAVTLRDRDWHVV